MLPSRLLIVVGLFFSLSSCSLAQTLFGRKSMKNEAAAKPIELKSVKIGSGRTDDFRKAPDKIIDILHTNLEVSFNWGKHECIGKETIVLKPYFYETDTIVLDAKGMSFDEVSLQDMLGNEIAYLITYDKYKLKLNLEKKLNANDTVKLRLRYIARPDFIEGNGGSAIRDDKGLYFINTDHAEPFQPVQLWTQGEPESNSAWFPTIDHPSEKFTMNLAMTVNKDLVTLSNGKLISSTIQGNARTDTWQSQKPMPAYLVMMAVGDFKITKDSLTVPGIDTIFTYSYDTIRKACIDEFGFEPDSVLVTKHTSFKNVYRDVLHGVEVSYYLEPNYAPYAYSIFKHTPEMIDFFSAKLGVDYPWEKYAQIIVRDYVSGAMENTSATLHGESVQKNNRELLDGENDDIIAHELFHQWFGDLVTCKSWSHLVLNEGFAAYGEQLWHEYKYGRDAALTKAYNSMNRYLQFAETRNDDAVINFNYKSPDDMFNVITYQKGARILDLLRSELGDDAFFKGLKNYLTRFACGNAEIEDLRHEFETVTGRDLRNFFKQWFYTAGHPSLELRYQFNDSTQLLEIKVEQKQANEIGLFNFPLTFKVTQGGISKYFSFTISRKAESFFVKKFDSTSSDKPNVFVDPYATFIGSINDNKPFINHIQSYWHASNIIEKYRSLEALKTLQLSIDTARATLLQALNDPAEAVQLKALEYITWSDTINIQKGKSKLLELATSSKSTKVKAKSVAILSTFNDQNLRNVFNQLVLDSSYTVAANALDGIYKLNPEEAMPYCRQFEKTARKKLLYKISGIYAKQGSIEDSAFYEYQLMRVSKFERSTIMDDYTDFCLRINKDEVYAKALMLLGDRASNDKNVSVRVNAMVSLHALANKLKQLAEAEKEMGLRTQLLENAKVLQDDIQRIVDREQDADAIERLKLKGITQTEVVKP
ncbi:MAG: M1 family metallopeptidase [Bacteroidetes bacterium]|nr:M1 family metallopeptidase [Bacteroidota bacterium]